jgi:hypothetical protein
MKLWTIGGWVAATLVFASCLGGPGDPADAGPGLELTVGSIPNVTVNQPWFFDLTAEGGVSPYHWTIAPGPGGLPPGIVLSSSGRLAGVPTEPGHWFLILSVTDSVGVTASRQYELTAVP